MPLTHSASIPPLQTPPVLDVSRSKLKQFAHWIRDDLDILVAREGPDVLRPDDVLALHELFVALRQSTTITALDLRATGIHKAVKSIAGTATRWPRRLCDDCDNIITIWTSKFGPFEELPPFLYGRGGRLEGIASATEYTREALLRRWSKYCPEKIHPNVSHRPGDLGFKAGDWWVNPLFAHHAGIVGLESVEGGTTHDKKGAYALVLKDTGEIDARNEEVFTYRCPIGDKGKYRLTAATPKSRDPIRVLRSHSINSIWGPKAGIRYEGLYLVKGWCVRQARLKDTMGGEWKEGDILYEVTLQRKDPTSMERVTCRPTNVEVDDYAEYKRLRKIHREQKRRSPRPIPISQHMLKAAPPIPPSQTPASPSMKPQSLLRASPSSSRQTSFKEPAFDAPKAVTDKSSGSSVVSPMNVLSLHESLFALKKAGSLAIPTLKDKIRPSRVSSTRTSDEKHIRTMTSGSRSLASSNQSRHSDLKEIIPWIDLELEFPTPPASISSHEEPSQDRRQLEAKAAETNPVKHVRKLVRVRGQPDDLGLRSQDAVETDTATIAPNLRLHSTKALKETRKPDEKRRLTFGTKARFIDGPGSIADGEVSNYHTPSSRSQKSLYNSADDLPQLRSPQRVDSQQSISLFDYGIEHIEFASPLDSVISCPRMATPLNSFTSPLTASHVSIQVAGGESIAMARLKKWLSR